MDSESQPQHQQRAVCLRSPLRGWPLPPSPPAGLPPRDPVAWAGWGGDGVALAGGHGFQAGLEVE